jgi:hypothetical protein
MDSIIPIAPGPRVAAACVAASQRASRGGHARSRRRHRPRRRVGNFRQRRGLGHSLVLTMPLAADRWLATRRWRLRVRQRVGRRFARRRRPWRPSCRSMPTPSTARGGSRRLPLCRSRGRRCPSSIRGPTSAADHRGGGAVATKEKVCGVGSPAQPVGPMAKGQLAARIAGARLRRLLLGPNDSREGAGDGVVSSGMSNRLGSVDGRPAEMARSSARKGSRAAGIVSAVRTRPR